MNATKHGPHGPGCQCGKAAAPMNIIDRGAVVDTLPLAALSILALGPEKVRDYLAAGLDACKRQAEEHNDLGGPASDTIYQMRAGDLVVMSTMAAIGFALMCAPQVQTLGKSSGIPDDFDTLNTLPI